MNEYELYQKLKDALDAIKKYENEHDKPQESIKKSIWSTEINESIGTVIQKSHVLGSAGSPCPRCNGTGRVL